MGRKINVTELIWKRVTIQGPRNPSSFFDKNPVKIKITFNYCIMLRKLEVSFLHILTTLIRYYIKGTPNRDSIWTIFV